MAKEKIVVEGGTPLAGEVHISGAKNSALKLIAAALLGQGESAIHNVPLISDIVVMSKVIETLGGSVRRDGHTLHVDTAGVDTWETPYELVSKMRASISVLGPLVARFGKARVAMPGGCNLGARKIDMHMVGMEALGVHFHTDHGYIEASTPNGLHGAYVALDFPSVGATENAMLAACQAEGTTVISNAAREPEIVELQDFLRAMGASVRGAGSATVVIEGRKKLHGCTHLVRPDRIVAATYLCAAAATGGCVCLRRAEYRHMASVLCVLQGSGCDVRSDGCGICLKSSGRLRAVPPVRTSPYPGFPTDAQAIMMAALLRSKGSTVFVETLFSDRYRHVPQLQKMGAQIRTRGQTAIVTGTENLHGTAVQATDLRGGAALIVGGLQAEGITRVEQIHHIERGYADIVGDLAGLGACIYTEK